MTIHEILFKYWRYASFRPLQEQIIQSVLDGNDTLALLPTGGGKSLCYQVPALAQPGICIVITPLIALMKDQVENLKKRGIGALAVFAGMRKREIDAALDSCIYNPEIKFLYLSPERLLSDLVRERIGYMKVNLFAVDEAHCISYWGYDFRPAYLQIAALRDRHPEVPFLAVTATATTEVVADIQTKLRFAPSKSGFFKGNFARANLAYMVIFEENKLARLQKIIQKIKGSGIVYVRNRRETQEVARFLVQQGYRADFYHAGLDTATRTKKQDAWIADQTSIMVATNAFGMGIDKPDVRFVVHLDIPDALEAYYQEAGRAGRDGQTAYTVLLYEEADKIRLQKNFELSFPTFEEIAQIYFNLGNYYQLAYGAGQLASFEFDISDFCRRFKLNPIQTIHALKFLERDEWISLSENVYMPSRLKFEIPSSDMYRFQVENAKWDPLMKVILRSYGSAFDYFVDIHELDLARKIGWSVQTVSEGLETLHALGVLHYIPQTDKPQLLFIQPRTDTAHLFIDGKYRRERQELNKKQLDAMLAYLEPDRCRSQKILAYFDAEEPDDCGRCDVCLRRIRRQHPEEKETAIQVYFIDQLTNGPRTLQQLMEQVDSEQEKRYLSVLRTLLDLGRIKYNLDQYYLN